MIVIDGIAGKWMNIYERLSTTPPKSPPMSLSRKRSSRSMYHGMLFPNTSSSKERRKEGQDQPGTCQQKLSIFSIAISDCTYHRDGAAQGTETLLGARGSEILDGREIGLGCRARSVGLSLEEVYAGFQRLTSRAGDSGDTVDVQLAALGTVDGRAEVDGSTLLEGRTLLDGGGGSEGCEGGEGEGGELHFGVFGCWLV
jgi:hypothetical protein